MQYRVVSLPVFLCLLFVAVLPMAAVGQDEEASTALASNAETIDDNVVVDQKSLAELRRDAYKAEEEFYSVYNKLNDDKEYDVRCRYETPTGTRAKNHVCRARFVTNAYERHARRNRNSLSRVANQDADPILVEKTAKFQEKLETLIAVNPELQEALGRYNTALARFYGGTRGRGQQLKLRPLFARLYQSLKNTSTMPSVNLPQLASDVLEMTAITISSCG